jgi:hypothetical protein
LVHFTQPEAGARALSDRGLEHGASKYLADLRRRKVHAHMCKVRLNWAVVFLVHQIVGLASICLLDVLVVHEGRACRWAEEAIHHIRHLQVPNALPNHVRRVRPLVVEHHEAIQNAADAVAVPVVLPRYVLLSK